MPPPLDDATRTAIIADIRAGEKSRNAIARDHGVSWGVVSKLARQIGENNAFNRSSTAKAVEAARTDAKALRVTLIADLYADAQRFRARSWEPYTQVITGPDGPQFVTTKLPPLRDQQAGYTALAICLDKALKLEAVDSDGGAEAGRTMVSELREALGLAYTQLVGDEQQPPSPDAAATETDEPKDPDAGGEVT
ncbi:hypothetical protein [Actinomadura rudentiformis]|uniref:Uncharacterized protein n=1 Tax=Actinomadura rudentiformis TaxID=359158 RepID=A0A6H9YSK2_9ACTN|nr:hypothetical protein [Actinomadura rudentiformis]KAB2344869.1 hypothetical protein F8566_30215 [Actinomadura rudentiformis]